MRSLNNQLLLKSASGQRRNTLRWQLLCRFLLFLSMQGGIPGTLFAQSADILVKTTHYGIEEGLSSKRVYQVHQDKRGFYWMVHSLGLDFFDGNSFFKVLDWSRIQGAGEVCLMGEDVNGNIWVREKSSQHRNLYRINSKTRQWKIWKPKSGTFPSEMVDVSIDIHHRCWLLDQDGNLWKENTKGSFSEVGKNFGGFEFIPAARGSKQIYLVKRPIEEDAGLVIASVDTLGQIRYLNEFLNEEFDYFIPGLNGMVLSGRSGHLAFLTLEGALNPLFLPRHGSTSVVLPPDKIVFKGSFKEGLELTLIDEGILKKFNFRGSQLLSSSSIPPARFFDPASLNLITDRAQNLWIFGLDGVSKLVLLDNKFRRYNWINPELNTNFLKYSTRSIVETADGTIYANSGSVLFRKKPSEYQMTPVCTESDMIAVCTSWDGAFTWMYASNKLLSYSVETGRSVQIPNLKNTGLYWSMFDLDSILWMGGNKGLFVLKKATGEFSAYPLLNEFKSLKGATVYQITPRNAREYWLATSLGLFLLDVKKGVVGHYSKERPAPYYLPVESCFQINRDLKGQYWIATSNGLVQWNPNNGKSNTYDRKNHYPIDECYAVYPDEYGLLWLSTSKGIIQFHPDQGRFRVFLEPEGIAHNEGNRISHFRAKDGTIYFGSINGITAFNPSDFKDFAQDVQKGNLVLTAALQYHGNNATEVSVMESFLKKGRLVLEPGTNLLTLYFSFEGVDNPSIEYFEFRMEGEQSNWTPLTRPIVRLISPSYGKHVLGVRAFTANGTTIGTTKIPIVVKPPFYGQAWFLLLSFAGIVAIIVWNLRHRLRRLQKQRSLLEQEVADRTRKIQEDKEFIQRQADELKTEQQARNRFFANVTHEFKTPISLVTGSIDLIRSLGNLKQREMKLLDMAERNAQSLLHLVDDILLLSVLDVNGVKLQARPFAPGAFLNKLQEEYAVLAAQKNIDWQVESTVEKGLYLVGDERLLRMMCMNLLSNAFKFTPAQGTIRLSAHYTDNRLSLSVRDTGRGIHPDDLPHVFTRFFQTSQLNAPAEGGTGIGLALCRELAVLMGGETVVSSEYGKGSTFSLLIPMKELESEEARWVESSLSKNTVRSKSEKRTYAVPRKSIHSLLIVEDNPDMRQLLAFILEDYYPLNTAASGVEAMRLLENGAQPSLIISDWMMPEMDGMQLLKAVRDKNSSEPWIPFVMLTARSERIDEEKAFILGVDDYVTKPFSGDSLRSVVKTLVTRYEERKKQYDSEELNGGKSGTMSKKAAQEWLNKLEEETLKGIGNDTFSVDQLAQVMLMGRTSFFQEVKRLTGLTPNQYVLEVRLSRARLLLETSPQITVRAVVKEVGFRDERYFKRIFKQRFGQLPSYYK